MSDERDAAIARLESDLNLPSGFVANLANEDDWSFIVKAHALVEAALTHALIAALRREPLRDTIARMGPTQKLRFAEPLGLIDARERHCLEALFAIRNLLAHDISFVQFSLKDYVASLSEDRRR